MAAAALPDSVLAASDVLMVVLQIVGTAAFALSGALAATRTRFDPFGIVVIGVIVAVGGGTVRDVLLDVPVFWIDDWWILVLAASVTVLAVPAAALLGTEVDSTTSVLTADAIGLAVFSIVGCDVALDAGVAVGIAVACGVITGITGGILRDLLIGPRIAVFTGQFYALAAAIGSVAYASLFELGAHPMVVLWLPIAATFLLRMWAIHRAWTVRAPMVGRIAAPSSPDDSDGR